jgi:hypothetical protein
VQIGGRDPLSDFRFFGIDMNDSHPLNLRVAFADHARRRLHGSQCTGRPSCAFHIKEGHTFSIR